jgi:SpoIID/LytB domain protein
MALAAGLAPDAAGALPRASVVAVSKPLPRIVFVAEKGASMLLHGTYPKVPSPCRQPVQPLLHARYQGVIEVGRDTDGSLFVIGELPIEEYLQGLGEMPLTWPMEALKAQAIAARTYAMNRLGSPDATGARLGYQLCATDACQVYRGMGVSAGPYGDRWRRAVRETADKILFYRGSPADTFYFSTSNGHTYSNAEVFGGAALPYLKPVKETDDGASPLSHWRASMTFGDVGRFLAAAGDWPAGRRVTSIRKSGQTVTVSGPGGGQAFDVDQFRADLNSWAHCLDPGTYPGGGLPQTVPSHWFSIGTGHDVLTMTGRGWGHGVGMVQWGAEGKAERGWSAGKILSTYYGGLRPRSFPEPKTIRVGIATGLKSVTVEPTGVVDVQGRTLHAGPPWKVTGGKRLAVRHTRSVRTSLRPGSVTGPRAAATGQHRHAAVVIPETSVVQLVLHRGTQDVTVSKARTVTAGRTRLSWTVPSVTSGSYRLRSVVTDGVDIVHNRGALVRVAGVAPSPSPSPTTDPSPTPAPRPVATDVPPRNGNSSTVWLILSALLAVVVGVTSVLYLARRSDRMGSNWDPGSRPPSGEV